MDDGLYVVMVGNRYVMHYQRALGWLALSHNPRRATAWSAQEVKDIQRIYDTNRDNDAYVGALRVLDAWVDEG